MTNQITPRRGAIYLANFNPSKGSEPGKVRPCLVLQDDAMNEEGHDTVIVLPLTTRLVANTYPMRVQINARDDLNKDSHVMIDHIRSIDRRRISSGALTRLNESELNEIERCLKYILDFEN